jgi:predicted dehydrogenase
MSKFRSSRREFLKTSTSAAVAFWVAGRSVADDSKSPNEKLNIACVGTSGQAGWNIGQIAKQNVVAFADVDSANLNAKSEQFPQAKLYDDFRRMLDAEGKRIDAVLVATPDHIHAPAAAMALRMGKHVYCEKPLSHSVFESRTLAKLARENKCVTQLGTQVHAGSNYRRVVEVLKSGAIGPVTEAYAWVGKGWSDGRFDSSKPAPSNLNWDLWLGPAPERPFSSGVHPANWRKFWDYGSGTLGDMGCHYIDLIFWALDLKYPTAAWAEGPEVHEIGCPAWCAAHWEFPARGDQPPVKLHWTDGGKRPEILGTLKRKDGSPVQWGDGHLFVGEKGMLLSDYGRYLLLPEDKFVDFKPPEKSIPDSIGHHNEWIQACKAGGTTTCNFDYSGALSETVLLGTVAYRVGDKLEWDAENLKATNTTKADQYLRREYRKGWAL